MVEVAIVLGSFIVFGAWCRYAVAKANKRR